MFYRFSGIIPHLTILGLLITQPVNSYAQSCKLYPPKPHLNCFTHGMRVVGNKQKVYLSHMPFFDGCHNIQAIFEATFEGSDNPQSKYFKAQQASSNNVFTIMQLEEFKMSELASKSETENFDLGSRRSFKVNLYQQHYERESTQPQPIACNVTVKLQRVVFFDRLESTELSPTKLEYLLFGDLSEQFIAHRFVKPPADFDQTLEVETPLSLSEKEQEQIKKGVIQLVSISRSNSVNSRLKPGDQPTFLINGIGFRKAIGIGMEYYLETKDLQK